jgi:hypothetical protein
MGHSHFPSRSRGNSPALIEFPRDPFPRIARQSRGNPRAFSSEVGTGSREKNALKQ